ncbi:hypothetical protein Terro_1243 [Terriglobus roseus DSM 18391]|uniref:Uncharacterized protein n=1 Tax=Terriglobus roseus (strain DSM 18391 / NRRL B-41598 / KBS 63) TaxID=926566 RepID=I3ZE85_TERRK|nr:hypothetical protein Terro_1243 [Terriglobus roseus DSM 18391]
MQVRLVRPMQTTVGTSSPGWNSAYSCKAARVGFLLWILVICFLRSEAQEVPRIFFTDLTSGPATGGEADSGAFVTLYGVGFGAERHGSYVTVGGGHAFAYPVWSNERVTIQLGRDTRSGTIVLHRDGVLESDGVPFRIRPGRVLFFPAAKTPLLRSAIEQLRPGDILYLRDGTEETLLDRYDAAVNVMQSGKPDEPIALVAYPGADVVIGSVDGTLIAARTPNVERTSDHWVVAGIHFRGRQEALDLTSSKDWRIVGNDFTCPHGFGPTGCVEISQASKIAFLGNRIHDVGQPGTTKVYHALYFSTDSNHIDVGWNTIAKVRGCRGIQFHSTPEEAGTGLNQYDIRIHDNTIHDTVCDGINLATINPAAGRIGVWNNLIYNVGEGPDPPDGSSDYACIFVQGGSNNGPSGSGTVEIDHNTMYRCGGRRNTDSGAISISGGSPHQEVRLRNNIIVLDRGVPLLAPNSVRGLLVGSNNLIWWRNATSPPPSVSAGFLLEDPMLRDPAHADFHLKDGSPAVQHGVHTGITRTLEGRPRDATLRPDVGAY